MSNSKLGLLVGLLLFLWAPRMAGAQNTEGDPDPYAMSVVDVEPTPTNMNDVRRIIGYPPLAREADIEGKVIVRVLVTEEGSYKKHIVLKDPHPLLTKAVEDKLPEISFSPAVLEGQPVKVWVTIPFDFKLMRDEERPVAVYSYQRLKQMPKEAREMVTALSLENQGLKKIPREVYDCIHLQALMMRKNKIREIPDELEFLQQLQTLDLTDNALKDVPDWLYTPPAPRLILLSGNPIPESRQREILSERSKGVFFHAPSPEELSK